MKGKYFPRRYRIGIDRCEACPPSTRSATRSRDSAKFLFRGKCPPPVPGKGGRIEDNQGKCLSLFFKAPDPFQGIAVDEVPLINFQPVEAVIGLCPLQHALRQVHVYRAGYAVPDRVDRKKRRIAEQLSMVSRNGNSRRGGPAPPAYPGKCRCSDPPPGQPRPGCRSGARCILPGAQIPPGPRSSSRRRCPRCHPA